MRKAFSTLLVLALAGLSAPTAHGEDTSTACSHWHADPAPGYSGPLPVGLNCRHAWAPLATWTVPPEAATTRFSVHGSDDPGDQTRAGHVEATLNLTPGSTLTLEMGGEGEASAVKLGDEPLIVAGGGDGVEPNFITPSAFDVETEEPGAPLTGSGQDGRIWVEWSYFYADDGSTREELFTWPITMPPPAFEQPTCLVPRLSGLRPVAARKALSRAHCNLGSLTRRPARPHRRGRIVRQLPAAGSTLPAGAAVAVVVGRRP